MGRKTKAYAIHWSENGQGFSKTFYEYTKGHAKSMWRLYMKENGFNGTYQHTIIIRNK